MINTYSLILEATPNKIFEKNFEYQFITERHIQALWFEQKFLKNLVADHGDHIDVISSGIWNLEAGPDFRKAHIKIGQKEYFGDIEIHLTDESWLQHGHHKDARYNQVILHVSLWKPKQKKIITTLEGKNIIQLYLEDYITIPYQNIPHKIDLELYPYKKFIGSGKCAQTLFKNLPEEKIRHFFLKAAEWRLEKKRTYLQNRVENPSLYLSAGLAMVLGYKNNSEAFLDLFLEAKKQHFCNEETALSWLLSRCGFFRQSFKTKWNQNPYYAQLETLSEQTNNPYIHLKFNQIRPLNHPIRRLAYLSKLISDPTTQLKLSNLFTLWDLKWLNCYQSGKWKSFFDLCKDIIPSYTDPYWNSHFLFENSTSKIFLSLVGEDLKKEIIINVFNPFLEEHALQNGNPEEIAAFQNFYNSLSAANTGKRKYLTHRFFGDTPKGDVLKQAYTEQGAYQLHYDFCVHFESSCEGCPFVERYKKSFVS